MKTLGVALDNRLTFQNQMIYSCIYLAQTIRHIRVILYRKMMHKLGCSLIWTRLDYCDLLLYDATVQGGVNTAACLHQVFSSCLGRNEMSQRMRRLKRTCSVPTDLTSDIPALSCSPFEKYQCSTSIVQSARIGFE